MGNNSIETTGFDKFSHIFIRGTRTSIILYACILLILGFGYMDQSPEYKSGLNLPPGVVLFICGLMLYHIKYHLKYEYHSNDLFSLIPAIFMFWVTILMAGIGFSSLEEGGLIDVALIQNCVIFFQMSHVLFYAFLLSIILTIRMSFINKMRIDIEPQGTLNESQEA